MPSIVLRAASLPTAPPEPVVAYFAGPLPVEDAQAWEDAGHDPGMYVYLLRERGGLSPWYGPPVYGIVPYPPGGAPFPTLPLAGGLVP